MRNTPLVTPKPLNGIATLINAAWSALLISVCRRLRSPALEADGRHILSDVVTSVGVLVGVGLVQLSDNLLLDPLIGAVVALYILWSGWRVVSDSVDSLMDRAVDARTELKIRETLSREAAGAIEVHDLRTRGAGRIIFIDFHLVVPTQSLALEPTLGWVHEHRSAHVGPASANAHVRFIFAPASSTGAARIRSV